MVHAKDWPMILTQIHVFEDHILENHLLCSTGCGSWVPSLTLKNTLSSRAENTKIGAPPTKKRARRRGSGCVFGAPDFRIP